MQTGAGKGTTKNDSLAGGGSWGGAEHSAIVDLSINKPRCYYCYTTRTHLHSHDGIQIFNKNKLIRLWTVIVTFSKIK